MIEGFKKQRALTLPRLDRLGVEGESLVRAFMRGPGESDVCLPQADKVEAFCFGANLESPRAEKGKVSEPSLLGWIKDTSGSGSGQWTLAWMGLGQCTAGQELKHPCQDKFADWLGADRCKAAP
jgi:hypothetical protein